MPQTVIAKNSRRSLEVEKAEKEVIQAMKERDPYAPDTLSPVARDKLGATSRLHKQDETLESLREYWKSRITPEEGKQIASTIERARQGKNAKPANTVDKAATFAMEHWFYRKSVLQESFKEVAGLYITAMERCMGAALPGIWSASSKNKVLFRIATQFRSGIQEKKSPRPRTMAGNAA